MSPKHQKSKTIQQSVTLDSNVGMKRTGKQLPSNASVVKDDMKNVTWSQVVFIKIFLKREK